MLWKQQLPELQLRTVATEEDFEAELRDPQFDLAILDYFFAGPHGLTLMQRLRRAAPRTPVIFFCGSLESSIEQRILEAGPDDFLYKNSTGFLLLPKLVKRHLARARLGVRNQELSLAGLRRLMDRASLGLFRADETGRLVDATPALLQMLEAESVEQLCQLGHCWRAPGFRAEVGAESNGPREPSSRYEVELSTAKGNKRWYSIALASSETAGAPRTMVGVVSDITEHKRLQEQVAQYERQASELLQASAHRDEQKAEAQRELSEFASVASHQLHEPVSQLREYTRLLVEDHSQRLDSDGQEYLYSAHEAARRIQEITNDLLQLVSTGSDVQVADCDANWVIEEAVLNLKPMVDAARAKIEWNSLPTVKADSRQLRLAFQNLISNAIKFYQGPDVPTLHISASEADSEVRFFFRDNGIGVNPNQREAIFQPFSKQSPETPGLGLGLPVCRRVVEKHHGRIWVESDLGQGSTFVVALPKSPTLH